MKQVKSYIIALTNLYGIVHIDKVIVIFNNQNADKISKITIGKESVSIDNSTIKMDELNRKFVYTYNDYFVNESIIEFDDPEMLLAQKGDKPYYMPPKNELLKYEDSTYFEVNKEYTSLYKYIKNNIVKGNERLADVICDDIQLHAQTGSSFSEIFKVFNIRKICFANDKQVNEVMQLINLLVNNTRIWENNGHTPQKLFELLDRPHLKPLPKEKFDYQKFSSESSDTVIAKNKIGRNDPCPCGSGKKYKKCCLVK